MNASIEELKILVSDLHETFEDCLDTLDFIEHFGQATRELCAKHNISTDDAMIAFHVGFHTK